MKTMAVPKIIENMEDLAKINTRYTGQQIGNIIGLSKETTVNILHNMLKTKWRSVYCVPYVPTEVQKHACLKLSKKLMKIFPTYNQRKFFK